MLEIAERLLAELDAGGETVVATVSRVHGSAPRAVGTSMGLAAGRVLGSISGGCVEAAAVEACERVSASGIPETAHFGFTDDDAYAVGLTCGGELDVVVAPLGGAAVHAELRAAAQGGAACVATIVDGPPVLIGRRCVGARGRGLAGDLDEGSLRAAGLVELTVSRVRREVDAAFEMGRTGVLRVECGRESVAVLVESSRPAPLMVIVGAVEFSAALAAAARPLGFRIAICDARPLFATSERFPAAHEVVAEWPHLYLAGLSLDERSVVCVLSHDDRFDLPVLREALESSAGYVGALGSRSTHERRLRALRDAGVGERALRRLHSPIGLDIGAGTPEETAVSILAEVLASTRGASARPLRELDGPIHATMRGSADPG